jgi:hypothetical protein
VGFDKHFEVKFVKKAQINICKFVSFLKWLKKIFMFLCFLNVFNLLFPVLKIGAQSYFNSRTSLHRDEHPPKFTGQKLKKAHESLPKLFELSDYRSMCY